MGCSQAQLCDCLTPTTAARMGTSADFAPKLLSLASLAAVLPEPLRKPRIVARLYHPILLRLPLVPSHVSAMGGHDGAGGSIRTSSVASGGAGPTELSFGLALQEHVSLVYGECRAEQAAVGMQARLRWRHPSAFVRRTCQTKDIRDQ